MIKAKELQIGFMLLLIAASFSAVFMIQNKNVTRTSTFSYDEVVVMPKPVSVAEPAIPAQTSVLPIIPPRILSSVAPIYPQAALENGINGTAVVVADIPLSGIPENVSIKISSGNTDLDNAAVSAVSQWRFAAATQNNQSLNSVFEVPVKFIVNTKL